MAIKRPARIKILGKPHPVRYLPTGSPELVDGDDTFAGRIDHNKQCILVEDGQVLAAEQDTLLHEVLHGIERAMDLEVPETVIHRLATGLLAVLKENPGFLSYLRKNADSTAK